MMNISRWGIFILFTALVVSGCGAGERVGKLNPFKSEETDEILGHEEGTERIPVLALQENLSGNLEQGVVEIPMAYVNRAWPQSDGYPTHAMQHTAAGGDLSVLWQDNIGNGSNKDRRLNMRPLIAEGAVFILDADGRISSRSLETGDKNWVVRLSADNEGRKRSWVPFRGGGDQVLTFGGGMAYDNGLVFVHMGNNELSALDASNGDTVWQAEAFTPFHTAPTVVDGRVFIITDDNELMVFNVEDGSVLWTYRAIAETARLLTTPSPAVLGEVVIAPFSSGEIVALRSQNGTVLWSDSLTRAGGLTPLSSINDIAASPVVIGEQVYAVSHSGIMAAFNLQTGERIWVLPASALHAPSIAGDFLFMVTTDGLVAAIERHEGQVRWVKQLQTFKNMKKRKERISWAGPILASGRLLLASSDGEMMILDALTGETIGDINLKQSVYIAPVIAAETVVVLTDEGRLIALR